MSVKPLNEPILEDDYPVYPHYSYLVDGKHDYSPIQGTVNDLKRVLHAKEIRRYDMIGRLERFHEEVRKIRDSKKVM